MAAIPDNWDDLHKEIDGTESISKMIKSSAGGTVIIAYNDVIEEGRVIAETKHENNRGPVKHRKKGK